MASGAIGLMCAMHTVGENRVFRAQKFRWARELLFKKNPGYPIFVKIQYMQQTKNARGIWWLVFFASTAALALAIYTHWEWLTLILPFQTTAFVKAMDIM